MSPHSRLTELRLLLGIERNTTRHGEKWISGIGALLGILAVYGLTRWTFPSDVASAVGGALMVTSMGASAVLLFAVPQGALSQPWAVVGGHLLSAFIGVSCQKLFPGHAWTAAVAVGLPAAPVFAQGEDGSSEKLETIVVTGSRIRRADIETARWLSSDQDLRPGAQFTGNDDLLRVAAR